MKKSYDVGPRYLELFRALIKEKMGIYYSPCKDYLLDSKLKKLLRKSNHHNIKELYEAIKNEDREHFETFVKYITTNHTFFYRESEHLTLLRQQILANRRSQNYIWCAAASTGEEVYSIIIELLEHKIENFLIVATDINRNVLRQMKQGVYSEERLKYLSDSVRKRYFTEQKDEMGTKYLVKDFMRKYYVIKRLNLIEKIRFEKHFHYIFCRNVLIYFDKETQRKVILNILENLHDDGLLFIGHSETLLHMSERLTLLNASVYKKRD